MTSLYHSTSALIDRCGKLSIFVFLLMLPGIFSFTTESMAQAVPPRSQGLQMIRPVLPPPEPPLEKEIGEVKQDVRKAERALLRRATVARTINALEKLRIERLTELDNLRRELRQLPPDSPRRRGIQLDIDFLIGDIRDIEQRILDWRGRERSRE